MHAWVWNGERVGGDDDVVDGNDVDVDVAIAVGSVGVAMWCATELMLDALCDGEHVVRVDVAFECYGDVVKDVVALKSPCCALNDATRLCLDMQGAFECLNGSKQVGFAIANVGTDVEMIDHDGLRCISVMQM